MVAIAQLVEPWIVIPVVVGSSPISHPNIQKKMYKLFCDCAKVAKLLDALALGVSVHTDVRVQAPFFAQNKKSLVAVSNYLQQSIGE